MSADSEDEKNFDFERLRAIVKSAGGPSAVARRANMHIGSLNNYLAGREMKISAAITLARACNVSLSYFATGQEDTLSPSARSSSWVEKFGHTLDEPALFFSFCLLMQTCQNYFIQIKRRPSLAEALTWVAGPYREGVEASDKHPDSLVAEAFKDPKMVKIDPWKEIEQENSND